MKNDTTEGCDNPPTGGPEVGDRALDFLLEVDGGSLTLGALATRYERLVLISQDRYRFHST